MQELMSEFYETLEWLLMVIAAALLLAFTLYIFVSKRMTRPIQRLKNCMLMAADGNLDALAYPLSKNEFSVLEKQYNRMLTDIKALIERNRKEQANVQKAELRALQAQINPHFLYNTLDAIMWMVAANDNAKAIEMLDQLSIFFRIGLSKGLDWISVREDIEHLYSYLWQHRTIAEASAVESPIRQETIGFPAHFFARAHNFKPPGRACQPEADSPMRT